VTPATAALERLARRPDAPGALLLTGTETDRLEAEALRLAAAWLCPEPDDPERRCPSCRRVLERAHPDLLPMAPDGLQIRIDQVREALAFAAGRPYESALRVAVIPRAELLGLEAANALLKAIEEPGARMRWILTATQPEVLLPTIRSRCIRVRLPAPTPSERIERLRALGGTEQDALDLALLDPAAPPEPEALERARAWRSLIAGALIEGLAQRRLPALILLAEAAGRAEIRDARRLAELLADAAVLAIDGPEEALRHPAVAGKMREVARSAPAAALREAALKASDPPPDRRRGNPRMHYEGLLLELYLAGRNREP
jgi:DNA polymerase-3 subunit delta'